MVVAELWDLVECVEDVDPRLPNPTKGTSKALALPLSTCTGSLVVPI